MPSALMPVKSAAALNAIGMPRAERDSFRSMGVSKRKRGMLRMTAVLCRAAVTRPSPWVASALSTSASLPASGSTTSIDSRSSW